ncbi:hypothetical protein TWF481_006328 [Arthrobotrys musiformis]|uniref:Uncharacterized protein n=1 Tax=Arthrobotrys musiformis TaxID=47236 RepID=A0AAV9WHZ9_9PEZI
MSQETILLPNGGFQWVLSNKERESIANALDTDGQTLSSIKGNVIGRARETCSGCGKLSGLDDFVKNAVDLGVHSKSFILGVLTDGVKRETPSHALQCSGCGTHFEGVFPWVVDMAI